MSVSGYALNVIPLAEKTSERMTIYGSLAVQIRV